MSDEKNQPAPKIRVIPPAYEEPDDDPPITTTAATTTTTEKPLTLADSWSKAMNEISLSNIKKLVMHDTFEIAGETYHRKLLTPKARIQLERLQNESVAEQDEEKKMEITKKQAIICLDGMTSEKFDNTDIGLLESVIGACIMAAKGFRKI